MAVRWTALIPSVLLVWIVCCSWAQLMSEAASPYGANMTDLMRHVEFFDADKDGLITITESIKVLISLTIWHVHACTQLSSRSDDPAFAVSAATATHDAFGPLTTPPGKLPSTNIHVSHIHGAVHGSDTGAYDNKGNFVPKNFDKIFQRFACSEENALLWLEVETMLTAYRQPLKPWTWAPAETEWQLIHFLGKDRHGYLHKDTVRGIYDGTVFPKLRDHTINPHPGHSDA